MGSVNGQYSAKLVVWPGVGHYGLARHTRGTVKGKGISFMEDDNNWHYRIPNEEEVKAALMELGLP